MNYYAVVWFVLFLLVVLAAITDLGNGILESHPLMFIPYLVALALLGFLFGLLKPSKHVQNRISKKDL